MGDLSEFKAFLAGIAIFGGLEDHTLDRVVSMLRVEEHPLGSVVVREGDQGLAMYIVYSGEVALYQKGTGVAPIRIARMGPGELFGEMTIIDIQPRSVTVIAEKPSVLYSITNRDLYKLYQYDMPGYVMLIQNVCRELSRRLRRANARITEVAGKAGDESTQIRKVPSVK